MMEDDPPIKDGSQVFARFLKKDFFTIFVSDKNKKKNLLWRFEGSSDKKYPGHLIATFDFLDDSERVVYFTIIHQRSDGKIKVSFLPEEVGFYFKKNGNKQEQESKKRKQDDLNDPKDSKKPKSNESNGSGGVSGVPGGSEDGNRTPSNNQVNFQTLSLRYNINDIILLYLSSNRLEDEIKSFIKSNPGTSQLAEKLQKDWKKKFESNEDSAKIESKKIKLIVKYYTYGGFYTILDYLSICESSLDILKCFIMDLELFDDEQIVETLIDMPSENLEKVLEICKQRSWKIGKLFSQKKNDVGENSEERSLEFSPISKEINELNLKTLVFG
jgi:hypothetical protein